METKDVASIWISLGSAALAALAIYLTRRVSLGIHKESLAFQRQLSEHQDDVRRQERVFRLLEIWSTGGMRDARAVGWSWLHKLQKECEGVIYLGTYRLSQSAEEQEHYYSISDVTHFFADLNTLIEKGMLDVPLVKSIFGYTIEHWFDELDKTDLRCSAEDTSSESETAVIWWLSHVRPLREKLK